MSFKRYKEIVYRNVDNYILNNQTKKTENGSFSELLFSSFSMQSINIKFGHVVEKSWNEYIFGISGTELDDRNIIDGSQVDILFSYNNIKYYFESKNNINIDTEKSIATINKVKKIEAFLLKENNEVVAKILSNRYSNSDTIKHFKKSISREDIFGYSQLFSVFNVDVTIKEWEDFYREVGDYIYKNISKES